MRYTRENRLERRPGGKDYGGAGTNIYRCKDGRYVHFTTNMPHMWREFAQNWMTDKTLAGPEWENPKYRDAHAAEVSKAFAHFIGQFTAEEFAEEAQRRHLAAASLNTVGQFVDVNSFGRANGFKRSSILSSAATPRPDFPCAFIDADAGAPAGAAFGPASK